MPPSKKRLLKCCVPNCDTVQALFGDDDNGIKLYKFPTDKPLMRKWVAQIGRGPNFIPTDKSRICSKHFQTGRKSYKPSHVDYIPNIFWYNTVKNSEFCSGCRRKVCKCGVKAQENQGVPSCYDEFNEKEMLRLFQTIDDESGELDSEDLSNVEVMDQTTDSDVTTAITFLGVDSGTEDEPDRIIISSLDSRSEMIRQGTDLRGQGTDQPRTVIPIIMRRTNTDDVIDCCVRGEDSIGEEILLRQYRKINSAVDKTEEEQQEEEIQDDSTASMTLELHHDVSDPSFTIVDAYNSAVLNIEAAEEPIVQGSKPSSSKNSMPSADLDSELEIEWRRRERILLKKHKAEQKKMVLEIIRNNQLKNQTIDELKQELKDLKKNQKSTQTITLELDKKIRSEYEEIRKGDIQKILDEANSNLLLLQTRWADEKKVLIEANSALARLCNGQLDHLNELQAEFMCSVISACTTQPTGISVAPPRPQETSIPIPESLPQRSLRFESCSDSNENIKYFTGLPTVEDYNEFYKILEPNAKTMSYWNGKSWTPNTAQAVKKFKSTRIDLKNRLFLTLVRYRRGFTTKELGFFFNCDPTYISCLFITFSKLMENDLVTLFLRSYDYSREFTELPEIVQTHYSKLYATLRLVEIRLENRPASVSVHKTSTSKCGATTYKLIFLCSPTGSIFFISSIFPGSMSNRDIVIESKVLDQIPEGSDVFVEQHFDVDAECIAKQLQLLIFPQEITPKALSEDDPWEIKLMIKCKSRIEKLIGSMKYFGIFDNGSHLIGNKNNVNTIIRVVLLFQHYIDTYCATPQPTHHPQIMTGIIETA